VVDTGEGLVEGCGQVPDIVKLVLIFLVDGVNQFLITFINGCNETVPLASNRRQMTQFYIIIRSLSLLLLLLLLLYYYYHYIISSIL